jgi:hypothetical protein
MELAGLEPATSWVRFQPSALYSFAMLPYAPFYADRPGIDFAGSWQASPCLLDQDLTTLGGCQSHALREITGRSHVGVIRGSAHNDSFEAEPHGFDAVEEAGELSSHVPLSPNDPSD